MPRKNSQADQLRRVRHWQTHISAQKESGLSRAEYCNQHNLSYHAATYWSRKFSKPEQQEVNLVPVTFASSIKIHSVPTVRSALKVILPNKIAIEVDEGFSPTTLTKLLATLERR